MLPFYESYWDHCIPNVLRVKQTLWAINVRVIKIVLLQVWQRVALFWQRLCLATRMFQFTMVPGLSIIWHRLSKTQQRSDEEAGYQCCHKPAGLRRRHNEALGPCHYFFVWPFWYYPLKRQEKKCIWKCRLLKSSAANNWLTLLTY